MQSTKKFQQGICKHIQTLGRVFFHLFSQKETLSMTFFQIPSILGVPERAGENEQRREQAAQVCYVWRIRR